MRGVAGEGMRRSAGTIVWETEKKIYGESRRRGIERNIQHTMTGRKANWIGHIARRNFLLKQVIEGKMEGRIEVTGRRGRIRK